MISRLLTALCLSLCLFLLIAQIQPVEAQSRKQNAGYLQIIKSLVITKNVRIVSTDIKGQKIQYLPKATPTIFTAPTPIPTGIKMAIAPTKKVTLPTQTNTATAMQQNETKVTPTQAAPPPSDSMSFIMVEINKYRASKGLGSVQTNTETCNFAATRAAEIVTNFSHDGFQDRIDNKTLPYASWSGITENIAMTSQYTQVVDMWIKSTGHAANMRADTPFVCVRQSGNYYAYEGMKP